MNKEVGPGAIAVIAAVLIVVIGIVAWRVFGSHGTSQDVQQQKQQGIYQDYQRRMGGGPPGAPPGAPPRP